MGKVRYVFNPDNLTFSKIELSIKDHLKNLLPFFSFSLFAGIALAIAAFYKFDSPAQLQLKKQQETILLKYQLLTIQLIALKEELDTIHSKDNFMYRSFFGAEPIPESMYKAGTGGTDKYQKLRGYKQSNLMIGVSRATDMLSKQMVVQSKSFDEIIELIKVKEQMYKCLPVLRPVKLEAIDGICTFGMRVQPLLKIYRMHKGVDLCGKEGTQIFASGDGVVIKNTFHWSLGNYITINHGFGYTSVYGHLQKSLVQTGDKVKRGDLIALMGTTGLSNVVHLHYEIYKNGVEQNPMNFYYNDLIDVELNCLSRNNSEAESFAMPKKRR